MHYTDFTNFIKIMKSGKLLSRNEALKKGFHDAARESVIGRTIDNVKNYVRFYYKELTPTIYDNEGIKKDNLAPHMPIPVLLVFNEDIIYHEEVSYSSGGGGSKRSIITNNACEALKFDWETIFSRGAIPGYEHTGDPYYKDDVVNKRNAEFLYNRAISIENLKKIIFRSDADLRLAEKLLGANPLFSVDRKRFNHHHNYLVDYNIKYRNQDIYLNLIFNDDNFKEYSHELIISNTDSSSTTINILDSEIVENISYNYTHMSFELKLSQYNKDIRDIVYKMNGFESAVLET